MHKSSQQGSLVARIGPVVLGWILPGGGHYSIGHNRRGLLIFGGVMFLVFCGVLIGGINAVDHENDSLWFMAQFWCGPVVLAIDLMNQAWTNSLPTSDRTTLVSLSHANEIGTLFIAMAGLMNFVVLLDVLKTAGNKDLERRAESQGEEGVSC